MLSFLELFNYDEWIAEVSIMGFYLGEKEGYIETSTEVDTLNILLAPIIHFESFKRALTEILVFYGHRRAVDQVLVETFLRGTPLFQVRLQLSPRREMVPVPIFESG